MKGIVFAEFLDMVDANFGETVTEEIIAESDLPSGGVYTAVGTYDHAEIVTLVMGLSGKTGLPVPDLVRAFGQHLLTRFAALYPDFFETGGDVLAFLERVDGYIHGEVRKLYPTATLPKLVTERTGAGDLVITYRSDRRMGDLAEGLITGAIAHFGER